jgi:hypothetical protein
MTDAYRNLVVKPKMKTPVGRPMGRLENNIKTDLKKIWYVGVDLINVAQDRGQMRDNVKTVMNLKFP